MMTFFTVPRRCFFASAPLVNKPVDSTTMSAPTEAQSISAGSFILKTLKLLPSTEIVSSVCVTLCAEVAEDRVVLEQVREGLGIGDVVDGDELDVLVSSAVRMMLRPMRPKPLMPTLMGILPPLDLSKRRRAPAENGPMPNPKCYGVRKEKSTRSEKPKIRRRCEHPLKEKNQSYSGYCRIVVTRSPEKQTKTVLEGGSP